MRGRCHRAFSTVSGDTDNIGNGLVLGLQAGAALANLEFVEYTLIYRVNHQLLRIAGMAPFLSRGGRLLNHNGTDLLATYFAGTPSEQIGRAEILRLVQSEIRAGRGPVWLDCTDFSDSSGLNLKPARVMLFSAKSAPPAATIAPKN